MRAAAVIRAALDAASFVRAAAAARVVPPGVRPAPATGKEGQDG